MISQLVIASNNPHKAEEIQTILSDLEISVYTLNELNISIEIEETAETFQGNSLIKAKAIAELTDLPVLADDSGLIVPWLRGAPGVHSARYAGLNASDSQNRTKLIKELSRKGIKFTDAYFVCVMTLLFDDQMLQIEGVCRGQVKDYARGEYGFGYDPLFYSEGSLLSFAEIEPEEKHKISHRGLALQKLKAELKKHKF
ncbi:MAG: RdgB/HAM1 family non-canonical purine NTP pyrophosphatase [Calditrichaeota bacterium]|nr:RdgB/HAM1 family non-canonical purine NTP pyrophosphatase [Calditrichota bacterium]